MILAQPMLIISGLVLKKKFFNSTGVPRTKGNFSEMEGLLEISITTNNKQKKIAN